MPIKRPARTVGSVPRAEIYPDLANDAVNTLNGGGVLAEELLECVREMRKALEAYLQVHV